MDTTNKPFMNVIDRVPVNIVGGDGVWLIDDQGNRYIDLWGDEGVASLGYGGEFLIALEKFASEETLQRLPDMYHNPLRAEVAAALCQHARFDRVFFCNSGAEANEAAIKLARRYWSKVRGQPNRFWVLTVQGNFHGRTGYALAASDSTDSPYHKQGYGPTTPGFGVIPDDLDIEKVVHWDTWTEDGDVTADGRYTNAAFEEADWSRVAAVTMAPILGNNVVKTYPKAFWDKLNALRAKHGFLIIFDEVQVGMGRTGNFCCHHSETLTGGVRPDINAMGKGLAMGLPAACILADEEIARAFVPGVHFSTFGGTLLSCFMMRELMEWLDANMGSILVKHSRIAAQFATMQADGLLQGFDGAGVHWGFTPRWDRAGFPDALDGPTVCEAARAHGILMCTHRKHGPIRFTPPLNVSMGELDFALLALRKTLVNLNG
jgi:acetylornithine/succinyldiaminopimelate/putrescine aminotransferase